MTAKLLPLLLLSLTAHHVHSQNHSSLEMGYEKLYESNPNEFDNIRMNFSGSAPHWLNGSLVRVGPALFELGNETKSNVSHGLDGFAKVAHWRFVDNQTVLFSNKFIKSTYYLESKASNKFTSNIFTSAPSSPLTSAELLRSQEVGIDNMDINIVDFWNPEENKFNYVATNDIWSVYELALQNLTTVRKVTPNITDGSPSVSENAPWFIKHLATAHPLPEPNTDNNHINILLEAAVNPGEVHLLKVIRMKSLEETEVITSFEIPEIPYLHSFSITNTKVVILMNPYILNPSCLLNNAGDCYSWRYTNESTTLHIVDLDTGNKSTLEIPKTFVMHHINAYDISDDELVADVCAHNSPDILNKNILAEVKHPTARQQFDPRASMKRIHINLSNSSARIESIHSPNLKSEIASTLDFPVINEASRSSPYCYVYGVVEKLYSGELGYMGIAKKDLCQNDSRHADALFEREGWYPSEPIFVPAPDATSEDHGVLLVPYTSGNESLTHLVILDALDLSFIDMAPGHCLIPQSQHGRYLQNVPTEWP